MIHWLTRAYGFKSDWMVYRLYCSMYLSRTRRLLVDNHIWIVNSRWHLFGHRYRCIPSIPFGGKCSIYRWEEYSVEPNLCVCPCAPRLRLMWQRKLKFSRLGSGTFLRLPRNICYANLLLPIGTLFFEHQYCYAHFIHWYFYQSTIQCGSSHWSRGHFSHYCSGTATISGF